MESKLLINIAEDKYRRFQDDYTIVTTDFLDLAQQSSLAGFIKTHDREGVFLYGGFKEAERRQLMFVPDYLNLTTEAEIKKYFGENPNSCPLRLLQVTIAHKSAILRHSDYLGALLSLGIKREKTGDILVFEGGAQIVVAEEISSYLAENYTSAGKVPIRAEVLPIGKLMPGRIKVEHIKLTISSTRLDNIVSAAFGVSRKLSLESINRGIVFVNSVETKKPDFNLRGGEKIVMRGKGKIVYRGTIGTSRKGKVYVEVDKYI